MNTLTTKKDLQHYLQQFSGMSIGFVPTMGALHQGHLSLLETSIAENTISVVSIFVNPTQFNDVNDFNRYPKNFKNDEMLLEANGCDILFLPDYSEIYPGTEIKWIETDLGYLEQVMEGKYRPGHYRGVKTVVHNLFTIINPSRAYFGKKDYQQMLIIKKMAENLNMPLQIIPCETKRESDGLAMSSRNENLNEKERAVAGKIPEILMESLKMLKSESTKTVMKWVKGQFENEQELRLQYFEILNQDDLLPVERADPGKTRVFIAAFAGNIRLIDNMLFIG